MKRTRSRTRDEYPHSLSYQASTLIKLPSTRAVDGRSTIDECALPLKSMETSSSSLASRMPRSLPAAASRNASLICCTLAGLASSAVRSTTETFGVGTRMAMPSSLPLRCGSTRPTAVAAPVVVGIMLTAPARARRRSLCGKSWIGWSLVYECTVEQKPRLIPNASSSTFTVVARQLVVQEALERSEEHTSELQSQSNLVCRLLLEKKKKKKRKTINDQNEKKLSTRANTHTLVGLY